MKFSLSPIRVVQGIVAIGLGASVYAISLPLRASGQRAQCQENLKRIGLATMQYTRDYDEIFMPAPKWKTALMPYGKFYNKPNSGLAFNCPTTARGYAFNGALGGAWLGLVKFPQTMAAFYEPSRAIVTDAGNSWNANGVHGKGSNVGFQDGHVKWLRTKPAFWVRELAIKPTQLKRREELRREFIAQEHQKQLKAEKHTQNAVRR